MMENRNGYNGPLSATEDRKDRRRSKRILTRFGSTVTHRQGVGQIVNLSPEGLAYDYLCLKKAQNFESKEHYDSLSLSLAGHEITIDKIYCRVVSDHLLGPYQSIAGFEIRRKCVAFLGITSIQRKKINTYLKFAGKQLEEYGSFCPEI